MPILRFLLARRPRPARWIASCARWKRKSGCAPSDRPARTLYVGGGTPSFLGIARLSAILDGLRRAFRLQPDCEITVEANPCDLTGDWLAACRAAGVNRLSVGVQGMRDEDLRFLGRAHTVADAVAAVRRARAAGFDNLGIDLIVGLPGHTAGHHAGDTDRRRSRPSRRSIFPAIN